MLCWPFAEFRVLLFHRLRVALPLPRLSHRWHPHCERCARKSRRTQLPGAHVMLQATSALRTWVRRIETVCNSVPLWHNAQLAIVNKLLTQHAYAPLHELARIGRMLTLGRAGAVCAAWHIRGVLARTALDGVACAAGQPASHKALEDDFKSVTKRWLATSDAKTLPAFPCACLGSFHRFWIND